MRSEFSATQDRFKRRLELSKESYKAVEGILNADQLKRLGQICLQKQGMRALDSATPEGTRIAEDLGLKEDQQARINRIIKDANNWIRDARRGRDFSEEANKKVQEIDRELNAEVLAVLTSEQKTKWKEMTGKPFAGPKLPGQ